METRNESAGPLSNASDSASESGSAVVDDAFTLDPAAIVRAAAAHRAAGHLRAVPCGREQQSDSPPEVLLERATVEQPRASSASAAGVAPSGGSARAPQAPAIAQAAWLFSQIASLADALADGAYDLIDTVDSLTVGRRAVALRAGIQQVGFLADLGSKRLGQLPLCGDAEAWVLSTSGYPDAHETGVEGCSHV